MGYVVAIVLLIVCVFEFIKHKTWVAPSVIFCGFWAFISFLAALRLYHINAVEMKTWLVIITGVLSFVLGTKVIIRKNKKLTTKIQINSLRDNSDYSCDRYIPLKIYWALFIIIGIYIAGQIIQTVRLLSTGFILADIRRASFGISEIEGYVYSKSFFAGFMRRLITAIETILIAAGIDLYFRNTKKNIIYIIAAIYLTLGAAFSAGGRWILLFFAVEFFCCRKILFNKGKPSRASILSGKKIKGIFSAAIVLAVILYAFSQISTNRGTVKENIVREFYIYICGCVPFLDVKMKEIDQGRIYSYFFAGQYGFWSYMMPVLSRIIGYDFPIYSQTTIKMVMNAQQSRYIGRGIKFNAFVTAFYYLYADFRFLGVFIGMFIFGVIAGTLFKRAKSDHRSSAIVPYLIVLQIIVNSIQVCAFGSADNVFAFIIMIIIFALSKYKIWIK